MPLLNIFKRGMLFMIILKTKAKVSLNVVSQHLQEIRAALDIYKELHVHIYVFKARQKRKYSNGYLP